MGRSDSSHYAASWSPPSYTVDDDHKIVGGYQPGSPNNWGRWGDDDQRGTVNFIGPEQILKAAACVETGKVFSLAMPLDASSPRFPSRPPAKHWFSATGSDALAGQPLTESLPGFVYNDDAIEVFTHGSTQWDGLAHVVVEDSLYNGFWAGSVTSSGGAARNGMEHVRDGFVGRGVLLDCARHNDVDSLEPGHVITAAELDAVAAAQGVTIETGDMVMVRTGYLSRWWPLENDLQRAEYMGSWPGIGLDSVEWAAGREVAAITCDTVGMEVSPSETGDILPAHIRLMVDLGLTIGEFWDLDELAADCAEDGRYLSFLSAPPLYIPRSVGSPLNPVAVK